MLTEIMQGEEQLEETEEDISQFRIALGLDEDPNLETREASAKSQKRGNRRVGQRKPKRDSVGVEPNAQ